MLSIAVPHLFVIYCDIIWGGGISVDIPAAANQASLFAPPFAFFAVRQWGVTRRR